MFNPNLVGNVDDAYSVQQRSTGPFKWPLRELCPEDGFHFNSEDKKMKKLSSVIMLVIPMFLATALGISRAQANMLEFSFSDPVNDAWGCPPSAACTTPFLNIVGPVTDVVGLFFSFDNVTGDYEATMFASEANPFIGDVRVNVNLFNGDTGDLFFDNVNDFFFSSPTTSVTVSGSSSSLLGWTAGDQVAACEGSGGIIPEPCLGGLGASTAFSSGVVNFAAGVQTARDAFQSSPPATISVVAAVVGIDIKPGDFPNSINLRSAGVIPVAILSSETFDALTIDEETIFLASAGVRVAGRVGVAGRSGKFMCHEEDVNDDGFDDLVCQIETAEFLIEPGEDTAELTAETFNGTPIQGTDSIRIVPH